MEKNRLSPYKLLFFEGISGTIINLFALIPSYFIKCKNIFGICNERLYDIGETIEHMKEKEFWLFVLLLFVSSLCFNVFVRLSLHCFSPTHLNVSDALSSVMYWGYVKLFEQSKDKSDKLFYNEILICYFCGFEYNTKKEISRRAENDVMNTIERNQDKLFIDEEE